MVASCRLACLRTRAIAKWPHPPGRQDGINHSRSPLVFNSNGSTHLWHKVCFCSMQVRSIITTSVVVNSDKSFPTPKFQTRKFSITWKGFEQQVNSLQSRQDPNAPTYSYVSNRPHNDIKQIYQIYFVTSTAADEAELQLGSWKS
jgi:hypothetical protein